MPLRIAIDARRIHDFGIGTYIRNLVRSLSAIDQTNLYTLITGGLKYPELAGLGPNFTLVPFLGAESALLTRITFPLFARKLCADVFHIPLNAVPFGLPDPYVVTIHDMGNLLFARNHGIRNNLRLARFRRGILKAEQVIAVSHSTERDVETLVGIPANRLRTIYNAPDPAFTPNGPQSDHGIPPAESSLAPGESRRILDRYQINYPFLLYAGRTNPQKNISRLVEAFSVLRGEMATHPKYKDLRLIIIGDEISKYPYLRHAVLKSRVEDVVRFLGFVPIETLRIFYQAASAFVFPSLYEGFGLPPLEAMACGTPVLTSNVSALPEVVGDAAVVVNPENVFEIARGLKEVLIDDNLRATLIARGFENLKRFSWERTAAEVLQTYREVAGSSR